MLYVYRNDIEDDDDYFKEWVNATKKLGLIFKIHRDIDGPRDVYELKIVKILHPEHLDNDKINEIFYVSKRISIGDIWRAGQEEITPYLEDKKIKLKDLV